MIDKEILYRYVEGEATNDDIEAVVAWLEADENNVQELLRMRKLNNMAIFNEPGEEAVHQQAPRRRKILIEAAKVAAVFLIFVAGSYLLNLGKDTGMRQRFYVPAGQRAELMLPDSSVVWLNAQTTVNYASDFGRRNREIELDGEAYFTVKKGEKHEFVVKTRDVDVRVLGTEFNVIAYSNKPLTEVALISGSVKLTGKNVPGGGVVMKPGHFAQMTQDGDEMQMYPIADYDYYRWKDGLLCFNNESIESILKKLELYYDTRIVVEKQSLLKLRYTGKFRSKDGVEQILKVLQLELRFAYLVDTELNLITIK